MKIDVLNGGFVRLVDHMGNDLSIVRAARVSFDADWRTGENEKSDDRLIHYLYMNRHTTPFEAVQFTFEIKCPIFVARQWHRHRTWSYNEVSARYTELDEGFYLPAPEMIGTQSANNKQARDLGIPNETAVQAIRSICEASFAQYKTLLGLGVPRELARSVLPVAAYTRYFGTVNLHNLLHFLKLRLHAHAQYEIRVYAEAIVKLIKPIVPVAVEAFNARV